MKVINLNFWHNFPDHDHVISTPPTARKTFTQYHSSPLRQNFHQQPFPVREVQLDYHSISTLLFLPCDAKISSSSFIPTSMNYFSGTGLTADRSLLFLKSCNEMLNCSNERSEDWRETKPNSLSVNGTAGGKTVLVADIILLCGLFQYILLMQSLCAVLGAHSWYGTPSIWKIFQFLHKYFTQSIGFSAWAN